MTVGELKTFLNDYDDDEIVYNFATFVYGCNSETAPVELVGRRREGIMLFSSFNSDFLIRERKRLE